jgi:hypothetical protein
MRSTLPHVDLQKSDNPGMTLLALEINPSQGVLGQAGTLGMSLLIPVRVSVPNTAVPLSVSGTICWANEQSGMYIPSQLFTFHTRYLKVPITDEQVARLEARRAGAQVFLKLELEVVATLEGSIVLLTMMNQTTFTISQPEWSRILFELGYGSRYLIELPPAPAAANKLWVESSKQISEMSHRLAAGDSGAALIEGRPALRNLLEAVGAALGRPRKASDNDGPYADVIAALIRANHVYRSSDAYEVLARTIELAKHIFGFASEPGHSGMRSTDRMNAELALGLITALYGFLARFPLDTLTASKAEEANELSNGGEPDPAEPRLG